MVIYSCVMKGDLREVLIAMNYQCMLFFFFNDTATTEIYTLSLHDALPILLHLIQEVTHLLGTRIGCEDLEGPDRKSTRLNSSHSQISYAVFCLKKKKNNITAIDFYQIVVLSDVVATRDTHTTLYSNDHAIY